MSRVVDRTQRDISSSIFLTTVLLRALATVARGRGHPPRPSVTGCRCPKLSDQGVGV